MLFLQNKYTTNSNKSQHKKPEKVGFLAVFVWFCLRFICHLTKNVVFVALIIKFFGFIIFFCIKLGKKASKLFYTLTCYGTNLENFFTTCQA